MGQLKRKTLTATESGGSRKINKNQPFGLAQRFFYTKPGIKNGFLRNQIHSHILKNVRMLNWGRRSGRVGIMTNTKKTSQQLERHCKGIANHRRIDILFLVAKHKGITVDEIVERLKCNLKTISEHIRRLAHAGLVNKKHQGRFVGHTLSPYGKIFFRFLKTF